MINIMVYYISLL